MNRVKENRPMSSYPFTSRASLGVAVILMFTEIAFAESPSAFDPRQLDFFESKIRPVLVEHCYACHAENADKIKGGLVLDSRDGLLRGGDSGPGVVPGEPEKSLIIEAIRFTNRDLQMPPEKNGGKLSESVIADFEKWVRMGAPDPREGSPIAVHKGWDVEKAKEHWAYQPIRQPSTPAVKNESWPKNDIDRFVLAGLEASGLQPVDAATPETLIRRLSFDLIGLPPTVEEVDAFVQASADDPSQAFDALVERLLEAPQFGERWGRHWLDVARYAESCGKDVNCLFPHAWRYRDYVIEAFNTDKPFAQFVREQIAGDLLPAQNNQDRAKQMVATGFLAMGVRSLNERDAKQFALDTADEQIDAMSQAFLGTTIACARCHDHKFDPISQRDYYALAGIFLSTETCYGTASTFQNLRSGKLIELPADCGLPRMPQKLSPTRRAFLEKELTQVERYGAAQFYGTAISAMLGGKGFDINSDPKKLVRFVAINAKIGELKNELSLYDADGNPKWFAMGVRDFPAAPPRKKLAKPRSITEAFALYSGRPLEFSSIADTTLFQRGDVDKPSEKVPRGFPAAFADSAPAISPGSSGRRELAEWLVADDNSLTSRVYVNRVWYWLFGRGLVESVDNFGMTGRLPSNPALLDHLAIRFRALNGSTKSLIREIVSSRAYQLSTAFDERNHEDDPENALTWRMKPRRLDAESIRDAMLSVSGRLQLAPPIGSLVAQRGDASVGGYPIPSLRAPLSDEPFLTVKTNQRSVYLPVVRNALPDALTVFDFAEPNVVNGGREVTTVPSQALYLLNNDFVAIQARHFAERLLKIDSDRRLEYAFRLAFARKPTEREQVAIALFFRRDPQPSDELSIWTSLCRSLMGSAEFRSID